MNIPQKKIEKIDDKEFAEAVVKDPKLADLILGIKVKELIDAFNNLKEECPHNPVYYNGVWSKYCRVCKPELFGAVDSKQKEGRNRLTDISEEEAEKLIAEGKATRVTLPLVKEVTDWEEFLQMGGDFIDYEGDLRRNWRENLDRFIKQFFVSRKELREKIEDARIKSTTFYMEEFKMALDDILKEI